MGRDALAHPDPDDAHTKPLHPAGSRRPDATRDRPAPAPATVTRNDWSGVGAKPASSFRPRLGVSVIVPYFEAEQKLSLTLASLERQTYPRELMEVIVVDDGSRQPPVPPAGTSLEFSVLRQEHRGFGAARARNQGARAARHGLLVFLDGDMIAERGMIEAHARWHHAVRDALTFGFRTCVDAEGIDAGAVRRHSGALAGLFRGRPRDPDWRLPRLKLTQDLTAGDAPFRVVSSCNFAIHKAFYLDVGGMDETFTSYGHEDVELAYRVHVHGGLLIPVRDAHSWHQGRWAAERQAKTDVLRQQSDKAAQLIAHPLFRPPAKGTAFAVPCHVVSIRAGGTPAENIAKCVDGILADPEFDLVVRIDTRLRGTVATMLRARYGADPRVRIVSGGCALDEFPASPFHLTVPPIPLPPRLVRYMHLGLGGAAVARATLGCGAEATLVRSWALRRARRSGGSPSDYGEVRQLTPRQLRNVTPTVALAGWLRARGSLERTWPVRCGKRVIHHGYRLAHRLRWRLRRLL